MGPLPSRQLTQLATGISLLKPLSRRGVGPSLIVIGSCTPKNSDEIDNGIPSHRLKWAEEGYTVVEINPQAVFQEETKEHVLALALSSLTECDSCLPKDRVGLVGMRSLYRSQDNNTYITGYLLTLLGDSSL